MSSLVKIRRVQQSDESQIERLFLSDVYHWSAWWRPVLMDGVVGLLAKPIVGILFCIGVTVMLGYHLQVSCTAFGRFELQRG